MLYNSNMINQVYGMFSIEYKKRISTDGCMMIIDNTLEIDEPEMIKGTIYYLNEEGDMIEYKLGKRTTPVRHLYNMIINKLEC